MYPWRPRSSAVRFMKTVKSAGCDLTTGCWEEACDPSVPLFERLRFVSIFCSNLDEFFMIRVGGLYAQAGFPETVVENKTLMTPQQQLDAIFSKTKTLMPEKALGVSNAL